MNTNIADRPLSLAGHLRNVATLLKNDSVSYDWKTQSSCNCGLVARSITGFSAEKLQRIIDKISDEIDEEVGATWKRMASHACPLTGIPTNKIFRILYDAGMRFEDFAHLEYQDNPDILRMVNEMFTSKIEHKRKLFRAAFTEIVPPKINHQSQFSLIRYLECWAALIERFHVAHSCAPTEAQLETVELRPLVKTP